MLISNNVRTTKYLWLVIAWFGLSRSDSAEPPIITPSIHTQPIADQTTIAEPAIIESSGLAFSFRDPNCVWTHNDSGDTARLFCLDSTNGQPTGSCELVGVRAIDWEAIWFDPLEQSVVLLAKSPLPIVGVYSVPMSDWSKPSASLPVLAKRIATLSLPFVTGADSDPQNGDVWLVTYWQAFCFRRSADDTLARQLARVPEVSSLPKWKQIEAVSIDRRSQVWITTEGSPPLLGRLTCLKSN